MASALACRESTVYLSIPWPSCAGWHFPSQQGQSSGIFCSSLSATKSASKPQAAWLCQEANRAGTSPVQLSLFWVAETSKNGAKWQKPIREEQERQSGAPSEAHSDLPTAKSLTAWLGLLLLGPSPNTTISGLYTWYHSTSVLLSRIKPEFTPKVQNRATEMTRRWNVSPLRKGWESWACSVWRRAGPGEMSTCNSSILQGEIKL